MCTPAPTNGATMHSPIIQKIETFTALSEEEKQALVSAIGPARDIGADEDIVFDGDRPSHSCAILEGFACRYKLMEDGRRQIMSFQIAGDICDLHSLLLGEMDHSIGTRSEEHTSELQSRQYLVCRLLLEKK